MSLDGRRLQVAIPGGRGGRGEDPAARCAEGRGGDVVITVRVQPDPRFERHGADLVTELPLTLAEALLGAEVPVPTPTGSVKLRVRPNTQNGQEIHIPGRGLPKRGVATPRVPRPAATWLCACQVVLPTLDEKAREGNSPRSSGSTRRPIPREGRQGPVDAHRALHDARQRGDRCRSAALAEGRGPPRADLAVPPPLTGRPSRMALNPGRDRAHRGATPLPWRPPCAMELEQRSPKVSGRRSRSSARTPVASSPRRPIPSPSGCATNTSRQNTCCPRSSSRTGLQPGAQRVLGRRGSRPHRS